MKPLQGSGSKALGTWWGGRGMGVWVLVSDSRPGRQVGSKADCSLIDELPQFPPQHPLASDGRLWKPSEHRG